MSIAALATQHLEALPLQAYGTKTVEGEKRFTIDHPCPLPLIRLYRKNPTLKDAYVYALAKEACDDDHHEKAGTACYAAIWT